MSIFASDTIETIDVPFDPGQTVTIQKLSGLKLERAQKAFFNEMIGEVVARGGAQVQKEIQAMFAKDPDGTAKAVAETKTDPLNGYDKRSLCYAGIKAWSCGKPLTPVLVDELTADGRPVKVSRIPAIDDLSEEALEFFASAVLKVTKPALFQTREEALADQKNA